MDNVPLISYLPIIIFLAMALLCGGRSHKKTSSPRHAETRDVSGDMMRGFIGKN